MLRGRWLPFLLLLLNFPQLLCAEPAAASELYGPTAAREYLLGRFEPARHPLFVELGAFGLPTRGRTIYLRREAAEALKRLYTDMHRQLPRAEFWVVSGVRSFDNQRTIWENKWSGRVGGYSRIADPQARARGILTYSSMPGTSRHHWGSDLDINVLQNDYYRSGAGRELFAWLDQHAADYGFCQPYTAGRNAGYNEERWHWSFLPLSRRFLAEWNRLIKAEFPAGGRFSGADRAAGLADTYVNTINPDCR
ncbi:MAG: M15 family metallopeptidase [Leptospirales bacterium]|nr:M15 family metallopeptidase [Leptospirales bacterium]